MEKEKSNFLDKNFCLKEINVDFEKIFNLTGKSVVVFSADEIYDLMKINPLFSREIYSYFYANYEIVKSNIVKDSKKNKKDINYDITELIMFVLDLAMCKTYLDFHNFIMNGNDKKIKLFKDFLNLIYINGVDLFYKYREIIDMLVDEKTFLEEEDYYAIIKNEFLNYLEKL